MALQSERGQELSDAVRDRRSKPQARRIEALVDISQLTFDDFQSDE